MPNEIRDKLDNENEALSRRQIEAQQRKPIRARANTPSELRAKLARHSREMALKNKVSEVKNNETETLIEDMEKELGIVEVDE